jgi:hypothetical protein
MLAKHLAAERHEPSKFTTRLMARAETCWYQPGLGGPHRWPDQTGLARPAAGCPATTVLRQGGENKLARPGLRGLVGYGRGVLGAVGEVDIDVGG